MSPEVLKHEGYNSKSDVWSIGCLLYEVYWIKVFFFIDRISIYIEIHNKDVYLSACVWGSRSYGRYVQNSGGKSARVA